MKPQLLIPIILHLFFMPLPATAEQFQAQPGFPTQGYIVPRIARTDPPKRIQESKPCRDYLSICERSCKERGNLVRFTCLEKDFQPMEDRRFNCQCFDDLGLSRK